MRTYLRTQRAAQVLTLQPDEITRYPACCFVTCILAFSLLRNMLFISGENHYFSVMQFQTLSYEETVKRGKEFGQSLRGGEVVLLTGPLGSGKTSFAKGIALGLEIDEMVLSPSFSIMNEYQGGILLYHFDFYRLDDTAEMEDLLQDYLYDAQAVCVIEWGEKIKERLPFYILVRFEILEQGRIITVKRSGM
jgi:tRNA threonylcarbamoyladenosine biosynthesis protein TsaE